MNFYFHFGKYRIEHGDDNPCEYPEKLWLFNDANEGMEIRSSALEAMLDDYFKQNF